MAIAAVDNEVADQPCYELSVLRTRGHEAEDRAGERDTDLYDINYAEPLGGLSRSAMAQWAGQPRIKGSSETIRMIMLTFSLIGIQFTWGIEMTYCTPYLLALGLSKSRTSLVWIAGPLSGLVMQPIVGVIADRSKSKYGRRRPVMLIGSVLVAACLTVLGWAKEIVSLFVAEGDFRKTCTVFVAVFSIYAVDFAINAVQSCCRSLIVDTLPIPKQQTGSAYASRMAAIGHLIGYFIGTMDLVKVFGPSFGDTQFKKLILVAAVALLVSVSVTSWAVTERVLISSQDSDNQDSGTKIIRQIFHAATTLPPRIQAICNIQLCSWIGWFPFLFYSTTFVGEIYFRYDAPHDVKIAKDPLGEIGRIGSLALVCFSLVTTIATLLLPAFIRSPDEEGFTKRPPVGAGLAPIVTAVEQFNKYKPDLITAWMWSHFLFSGAMALTPFAHSFRFAALLVSFCGIPWSLASWAPSAFMGIEINRLSSSPGSYRRLSTSDYYELNSPNTPLTPTLLRLEHGPSADDGISSTGELAGLYLGILNIYTTIPQFIGTFISMIVFSILEPGKSPELATDADPSEHHGTDGPNAIAVCLFIGAICAIVASFATKRLKDLL